MAAIKFPFTERRLDLIFPSLSILIWGFNIKSVLLRYLLFVVLWAISISDLVALGVEKEGIIRRPRGTADCGRGLPRRS